MRVICATKYIIPNFCHTFGNNYICQDAIEIRVLKCLIANTYKGLRQNKRSLATAKERTVSDNLQILRKSKSPQIVTVHKHITGDISKRRWQTRFRQISAILESMESVVYPNLCVFKRQARFRQMCLGNHRTSKCIFVKAFKTCGDIDIRITILEATFSYLLYAIRQYDAV